jgi:chromosome partitioning protein
MRVVVWNSQKGGSGKTSLCAAAAVEAERAGDGPVFLIDTDPQGTLSAWHEIREAETPARIEVAWAELPAALKTLEERGTALCCIDTAPNRGDEVAALFRFADLVLVPVRPSPADLWAVAATVALLNQTGRPFLFVLNQATLNANITAEAAAALSHHGRVARTIIPSRVGYPAAMTSGLTAPELTPRGPAATEIARLWGDIKTCLHAGMPRQRRPGRCPSPSSSRLAWLKPGRRPLLPRRHGLHA